MTSKKTTFTAACIALAVITVSIVIVLFCYYINSTETVGNKPNGNVTVDSGSLDISASVSDIGLYSPTSINTDGTVANAANAATGSAFASGGSATFTSGSFSLSRMTPGDKLTCKLTITNGGSIGFKYRVCFVAAVGETFDAGNFLIGIGGTYYTGNATEWTESSAPSVTTSMSIELPTYTIDQDWQDGALAFSLKVEAVQPTADVNDANVTKAYPVGDQAALDAALAAADCDTVIISGAPRSAATVTLAAGNARTYNIRGYSVGAFTINAPDATINEYINVNTKLDVKAIGSDSLHIYGRVPKLELAGGRAVVEPGSTVGEVRLIPAAAVTAKLVVAAGEEVERIVLDDKTVGSALVDNAGTVKNIVSEATTPDKKTITVTGGGTVVNIGANVDALIPKTVNVALTAADISDNKITIGGADTSTDKYLVITGSIDTGRYYCDIDSRKA